MKKPAKPTDSRLSDSVGTLRRVAGISFLVTGALLLGWDLIEHAYLPDASGAYLHRMHIVRGISTGVLVSVGIAWLLLRNRTRYEQRMAVLQQELIRKERLAAVGELAGGVAHEIRNPLAGIGGALTMLARETPQDDDTQEMMDEIQKQIHRMERLVQDLLAYARPGLVHPEWVDVHSILKQATASISQLPAVPKADLVLDLDPQLPQIYADPRELEHTLENLILNAFQAVTEGGRIEVCTRRVRQGIHISVSDNGSGMDGETQARIFEPFFTTKARGTGLGLSLVRRAIDGYGGEIVVHSKPGKGTTFNLLFPTRAEMEIPPAEESQAG